MTRPPRPLRAMLGFLLPATEREHLLGEMDDLFARRAARAGRLAATLWYLRRGMGFPLRFGIGALGRSLRRAAGGMAGAIRDTAVSWRVLRRRPGYTLATVLTLGVGVGGAATVYAAANWVLLRPVPGVASPDQVLTIKLEVDERFSPAFPVSAPDLAELRERVPALIGLEASAPLDVHVDVGSDRPPERVAAEGVTSGYFPLLGLSAQRGRLPSAADRDAADVVVVSHRFALATWADPSVAVGASVDVNGRPHTVIGVLPPGFRGAELPGRTDLWLTAAGLVRARADLPDDALARRDRGIWRDMVGRLRPGSDAEAMSSQADRAIKALVEAHGGGTALGGPRFGLSGYPGLGPEPRQRAAIERTLTILGVVSALLLLLAVANLTNLALAHAVTRRATFTVHAALGAGRARLVRAMASEHGLLGLLGAAVGVFATLGGVRAFRDATLTTDAGSLAGLEVDGRVMLFVVGGSLATAWLTAVLPAVHLFGRDLLSNLGRGGTDRRTHRLQSSLVVTQVAVSVALLISAGLLTRTVLGLRDQPLGFQPDVALRFAVDPRIQGYDEAAVAAFLTETRATLLRDPGAVAVGFASPGPVRTSYLTFALKRPGAPEDDRGVIGGQFEVTPGFLEAMGVRLVAGRTIGEADLRPVGEEPVGPVPVVLTRRMIEGVIPDVRPEAAIGRVLDQGWSAYPQVRVVGVVDDLRLVSLGGDTPPLAFLPWGAGLQSGEIVGWIRTERNPRALAGRVPGAVREVDPGLPVYGVRTARARVDRLIVEERVVARLALALGAIGLLLAGIGIHGVLGYAVTQRRREIGVRAALGASRRGIVGRIVGRGLLLAALGIAVGSGGALLLTRLLRSRLFGVEPLDPVTWIAGVVVLMLTAWAAAWGPARRATRIPPREALVAE